MRKYLLFMFIGLLSSMTCFSAVKKSGYVGDYIDLECSKSYSDLVQLSWKEYSGPVDCVTLTQVGYTNMATVHIDKYFTGTVIIRCTYNTKSNMPGTEAFEITCSPVTLNPSPTSISLEVGDKETITYTTSPYGHYPEVSYSSSNENVATVSYAGVVTAKAKGSATITLSNSEGPSATVKVSVGSGGGGGGGDDPNPDPTLKIGDWFYENTKEGYSMQFCVEQINGEVCCAVIPRYNDPTIAKSATGSITIPRTAKGFLVRAIENSAFSNCSKITSISIPNTVNSIQSFAFDGCTSLVSVTSLNETPPKMGSSVFPSSVYNKATLYVPEGCKSKYKGSTGWNYFNKIDDGSGDDTIEPTSITVSPSSKTINVNETFYVSYTLTPSNATTSVTWSSDDTSIATVSSSGLVKGINAGSTYINAKTTNGKTSWCKVTVTSSSVEPTGITVSPSSKTINVNETFYVSYTLSPSNAETTVTWYSDDSSIATVNSSGLVKGIKAGTTYINAKTLNGKEDWCKVTVNSSTVEPTSITLPYSITVNVGESVTMTYTLTPSNATTTLTWSSDDTSIATVSSSGVVKGIKVGTTKIRVKTSNGLNDYCNVTVKTNSVDPVSITLTPSSKTIAVDETFSLDYTLSPSNATATVTWSSDNPDIATVSSSGLVRGISNGSTYINVKTHNGKSSYCRVIVTGPSEGEEFTETVNGINMKFRVTSVKDKTCEVYGEMFKPAVDIATEGHVTIPEKANGYTVTGISHDAFDECEGITGITIPNTVTTIGTAFCSSGLTSLTIPKSVKVIDGQPFQNCRSLASLKVENGNANYDSRGDCNAIIHTATNELIAGCQNTMIPNTVKVIGDYAFNGHGNLTAIDIPDGVIEIGEMAFFGVAIKEVTLPRSISSMGYDAFLGCEDLENVYSYIEQPFEINDGVFGSIAKFSVLYVPKGTRKKYRATSGWEMFDRMVPMDDGYGKVFTANTPEGIEMTFIVTSEEEKTCQVGENPTIDEEDRNIAYGNRAVPYSTAGSVTIPEKVNGFEVERIADVTFINCPGITSVSIPNTVIEIGKYAFQKCTAMESVSIPNSVKKMGSFALSKCEKLTEVTLPYDMAIIDEGLFWSDTSLRKVTLPVHLQDIGWYAFNECSALSEIYSYMTEPCRYIIRYAFDETTYDNATLYVPKNCKEKYENHKYHWYLFKNIVDILDDIRTVNAEKNMDDAVYDLTGRKLQTPRKGINIIGGKKVIIK